MRDPLGSWSPHILSLTRIVTGLLFLQHGGQKLLAYPMPMPPGAELTPLVWTAGILELFGGFLILIGLFTRPVAFLLSGEMAVAYFWFHAPRGPWPLGNGGELALLYSFVYLYLAAAGGGAWSADRLRERRT